MVRSPGRSGEPRKKVQLGVETRASITPRFTPLGKTDKTVYTVTLRTGTDLWRRRRRARQKGKKRRRRRRGCRRCAGSWRSTRSSARRSAGWGHLGAALSGYPPPGAFPGAPGGYPPPGAFLGHQVAIHRRVPIRAQRLRHLLRPGSPGGHQDEGGAGGIPTGAIQGKIVQSIREDTGLTLYLNQGTKAKVKVGMTGFILVGGEGGEKLEGGTFTITKVTGDAQSVATTKLSKPLGKNNRFYIAKDKK